MQINESIPPFIGIEFPFFQFLKFELKKKMATDGVAISYVSKLAGNSTVSRGSTFLCVLFQRCLIGGMGGSEVKGGWGRQEEAGGRAGKRFNESPTSKDERNKLYISTQ